MACLTNVYEAICCINKPKFPTPYDFGFNGRGKIKANEEMFQSNFVKTSKYTWYDFLPKSLLLQFKRLANIYFLIVGILQSIPIISPLGVVTAWIPLIVVLAISMLRQGFEDYQRYKSDRQMNHELMTQVVREGIFQTVQWSKVVVGDVCKVQADQLFPADMILLSSSIQGGIAFIETASLDGEKNLKPRSAYPQSQDYNSLQKLEKFEGNWQGIVPDKQLHKFSSKMTMGTARIQFYGDKQLLYRGSRLKNTKWVYGLAIYTGRNTKIMMNSDTSSQKMSQIEVKVNKILGIILLMQILLCFIIAILNGLFRTSYMKDYPYIGWSPYSSVVDAVLIFFTYFVLLNTMIPISLIVSIEIVKMSQSYFIDKDNLMYSQFRKKNANVKSASLNEELGQIEYIFTDKTGTLTMNLMEFKIAVIGTQMYGDLGLVAEEIPIQEGKGFRDDRLTDLLSGSGQNSNPNITIRGGGQSISFNSQKQLAQQFLTALATAHQVVAEPDKKGKIKYQGPSPDEITLVEAAKQMKFQFVRATQTTTTIKVRETLKQFQLLQLFPFNSDRKRMSVVLKDGNTIKLYMKGADSIVKSRLAKDQTLNLDDQTNKFARIGLRTLLIGMRIIPEDQYRAFVKNVESLPASNKQNAFNELVSKLETGIYLIGATAVLDRLQDDVPQTIRDLIRANIKIWMLTGDKMETAENIAKSCNLIQHNFEILRYDRTGKSDIAGYIRGLAQHAQQLSVNSIPKGLLINGEDLTPIIGVEQNQIQLANLARYCQAVVCCRLLPSQKADVVKIVRIRLNKITLSIGDGANDVPMIKNAHIGVGLFGEEGMGAVQASDYALPEFRMLWRLLLVHGRWNYMRISEMILYFFYKNMLFTIPQFLFAFYCGYSGQTVFDDVYISLYNLFFTSLPLVVRAIFEQDVNYVVSTRIHSEAQETDNSVNQHLSKPSLMHSRQDRFIPKQYEMNRYLFKLFPKIYFIGQENCIFNYPNYFMWVTEGIAEAVMISLFCLYILSTESVNQHGLSSDFSLASLTIFSSVVMIVTFKLSTHTRFWSAFLVFCIVFLSLGLYVAYMWISNYGISTLTLQSIVMNWSTAECYFIVLFCCCFVVFVDGVVLSIDFQRGGYASKMRVVINQEKQQNKSYFQALSLRATQMITMNHQQISPPKTNNK